MAITIQQQPFTSGTSYFFPVGNPIEFLVSSSLSTAPNFKIEVKVYSPDTDATPIATLRYDIIPSTTQILFDARQILQSKITEGITNLRTSATGIKYETTKYKTAKVTFGESYGAIPSVTGSPTSSGVFNFYNGFFKYQGWAANDWQDYNLNSGTGTNQFNKLLTGFDNGVSATDAAVSAAPATYFKGGYNVKKINYNQLTQIQWLWKGASGSFSIAQFAFFTEAPALSFSYSTSVTSVASMQSMNIGTAALLAIGSGTILGLDSNEKYFYVCIKTGGAGYQLSKCYLYEIDWTPCSKFETFEIHWLNRYGGWDSWIFNKRSRHTTEIERQSYNPTFLPISGSTIVRNSYDITGKNFIVSTKESYTLNSDILKQWELDGLEDLITSPMVYWNSPDGFVNITVKDPNVFEHKTNTVDKLFNLSFSFEIDNQDRRQ
jgi:hypothetical protein